MTDQTSATDGPSRREPQPLKEAALRPTTYGVERPASGFDTILTLNRDRWRIDPHAALRLMEMLVQQLCARLPSVHDLESIEDLKTRAEHAEAVIGFQEEIRAERDAARAQLQTALREREEAGLQITSIDWRSRAKELEAELLALRQQLGQADYQAGQRWMQERIADVVRGEHPQLAEMLLKLPLHGKEIDVTQVLNDAAKATRHLTDVEREAERPTSEVMNMRLDAARLPAPHPEKALGELKRGTHENPCYNCGPQMIDRKVLCEFCQTRWRFDSGGNMIWIGGDPPSVPGCPPEKETPK